MQRDLHKSLKSEKIKTTRATTSGVNFFLVKLQWGKDDSALSLHADPNSVYLSGGYQSADFLAAIGFKRSICSFTQGGQCYSVEVLNNFDLDEFTTIFDKSFSEVLDAQRHLQACGYNLEGSEGTSYYLGHSNRHISRRQSYVGDGHTSSVSPEVLKSSEDDAFYFKFTFVNNSGSGKGWTIHYRPKHLPLSSDIRSVFNFIGIDTFSECPEFNFEECFWKGIPYQSYSDRAFDSNANESHAAFDGHQQNFSLGIKALLQANAGIENFGMVFLPIAKREVRVQENIRQRIAQPTTTKKELKGNFEFDVAISFAGTERQYAEKMAEKLRAAGYSVFYDDFFPENLWGADLAITFAEIYGKKARYCVVLVSNEYNNREWTIHERSHALQRMIKEKGKGYILPIKIDDVSLPCVADTIGYSSIKKGIETISDLLIKKLSTESTKI